MNLYGETDGLRLKETKKRTKKSSLRTNIFREELSYWTAGFLFRLSLREDSARVNGKPSWTTRLLSHERRGLREYRAATRPHTPPGAREFQARRALRGAHRGRGARAERLIGERPLGNLTTCSADLGSDPLPRGRDISTWALSRRAWATVTDLGSTLPPLLPWAAERVATWQEAWQKASALASNMPIAVVDLMPVEGQESENKSPFETEFGAYIYDKGYRQLFRALGYPGADAEAALALVKINRPAGDSSEGRICLDLSCGPGIITTRLASGLRGYEILVASDVSEAMTRRAAEQLDAVSARSPSGPSPARRLRLRRGARGCRRRCRSGILPSMRCTAAGAHCWPDPMDGLRR